MNISSEKHTLAVVTGASMGNDPLLADTHHNNVKISTHIVKFKFRNIL